MTNRHVPNCRLVNKRVSKKENTVVIGIPLEEKLDNIINSYLLFNNRYDVVEWTGFKSINSYKPLSLMSKKRQYLVFNMFDRLANACLHLNDFNFDSFLTTYHSISLIYAKYLKRSRILNRCKQKNIHDFLSYYWGLKKSDETNKWIVKTVELIRTEMSPEFMPLLILMILEIIPPFGSQMGCGTDKNINIEDESSRASRFITEYIDSSPNRLISNESFELSFNQYHYINRLVIIEEFRMILNKYLNHLLIAKHSQETDNNKYEELTNIFEEIHSIKADGIEILCKNNDRYFISSSSYPEILDLRIKDQCQVCKLGETIYILIDKINLFITSRRESKGIVKL